MSRAVIGIGMLFFGCHSFALDCTSSYKELRYPHGKAAISEAKFRGEGVLLQMDTPLIAPVDYEYAVVLETMNRIALPLARSAGSLKSQGYLQSVCVEPAIEQLSFDYPQFGGHRVRDYYQKLEEVMDCVCR